MTASASSQVRVGVRIRPLTSKETSEGGKAVVDGNAFDRTVSLSKRKFTYDSVFASNVSQSDLYANVAPPLLSSFLNGYNATILAYGQTGAGKTYSMGSEAGGSFVENVQGGGNLSEKEGLIPRFMSDMYTTLFQRKEESEKAMLQSRDDSNATEQSVSLVDFKVTASFLEIYGEDIYDLLDEDRNPLKIREDSNKEVIVVGLKSTAISNAYEAMNVLNVGTMNRTTGQTLMNCTSSRSHAIFTVKLQQTTRSADGDDITTTSQFTFVDLAGSERMKKTGAEGTRAKEGIKINEGLLALGNVINALADEDRLAKGEKVHVPYRSSKLTRLLQDALGGNSQTLFLACVSPSDTNASETLSTLHYANRARNIKNAPTKNVDATAEELRRLRIWGHLLKCELIKQKFTPSETAEAASGPELDKANECVADPTEIGAVSNDLLRRADVVAYMNQIEEKVSKLSGSSSHPTMSFSAQSSNYTRDNSLPQSFLETASSMSSGQQLGNAPIATEGAGDTDDDDDDSDYSDIDVDPAEDMQIIDELLETQQHEDIDKIDGDIKEQEERLLQLKEHIKVYTDMKEKYELLESEVQKLESEKQELAEKLEKALNDPSICSVTIKARLHEVKTSLQRARQDVRKQQQKAREAELEAQRCKGLERRIEEMKSAKANLLRKQKDDAKRQKDFSKTKAREIQDLRRKERSAQKKVVQQQMEIQRLKANLERGKSRYEKLAGKLKVTESNLKQALAKKRSNSATGARRDAESDTGGFASASPKVNSMKFVFEKTVSDRVTLSQHRKLYAMKAAERETLVQAMAKEVSTLNELKRESESNDSEPSEDQLAEMKDREANVQEYLIRGELAENSLEELRAKHPSIEEVEDERETNVFEEHEPVLKMIGKLNAPLLRTLLLSLLGSCYRSELERHSIMDDLLKKESTLSNLETEITAQDEKVSILSKSLERQHKQVEELKKELNASRDQLDSCKSEKTSLLADLKKAREALKDAESVEAQINSSAHNKDTLLQELEKTSMIRKMEQTKAALSKAEKRYARLEIEVSALRHERKLKKTVEQKLAMCISEKTELLKELDRTKKALSSSKGTNGGAVQEQPQDAGGNGFPDSLAVDTNAPSDEASFQREAPSSARSSSSANVPTHSKFVDLKQRYLKKVKESPAAGDR